jgi:Ca2+-binding RTX toxin-like protein
MNLFSLVQFGHCCHKAAGRPTRSRSLFTPSLEGLGEGAGTSPRLSFRPRLEILEDRTVPALIGGQFLQAMVNVVPVAVVFSATTDQTVTLTANVRNIAGPIDGGTVTFTVVNTLTGTPLGSPITVDNVNGVAQTPFTVPAGTPPGTFTITATFSGNGSTGTSTLTIGLPALDDCKVQGENDILGTARTFAVLAGSTATSTGATVIIGNVGVFPGASGRAVTGLLATQVTGTIYADTPAGFNADPAVPQQAQTDARNAFTFLAGLGSPPANDLTGQVLGQDVTTLGAGVYHFDSSAQLTGVLTLSGDADDVFVFQIGSDLTTASGSSIVFIGGAVAENLYWQVGSSATLGTTTAFAGTIIADQSVSLNFRASIECGRAIALIGAVTMIDNFIDPPFVPAALVNGDLIVNGTYGDDTITINPNSDVSKLDVTINGQLAGTFSLNDITGHIEARGFTGTDKITLAAGITADAQLFGGSGNDILMGGSGHDTLDGGQGNDQLAGGKGNDTYVFTDGWGSDKIAEASNAGTDRLDFSAASSGVTFTKSATVSAKSGLNTVSGVNLEAVGGGSGSDTLVSTAANTWNLTANNAGTLNTTFSFTGIENLTGGASTDTFKLGDGFGVAGSLTGAAGVNTLDYSASTTAVTANLQTKSATNVGGFSGITAVKGGSGSDTLTGANLATTWSITAANAGKAGATAFSSFESLTGGTLNDTFKFSNGKGVSGAIDGGDGVNTLNYAAYLAVVKVNLPLATATGTGGISNISNVTGGAGNDILVGNAADNLLLGGAGRDILIGGAGTDTLNGGAGDDILVGGVTDQDNNWDNLDAIMAAWANPSPYLTRITSLASLLSASTVHDDSGASDSLTGGLGLDWFLASTSDVLADRGATETNTVV